MKTMHHRTTTIVARWNRRCAAPLSKSAWPCQWTSREVFMHLSTNRSRRYWTLESIWRVWMSCPPESYSILVCLIVSRKNQRISQGFKSLEVPTKIFESKRLLRYFHTKWRTKLHDARMVILLFYWWSIRTSTPMPEPCPPSSTARSSSSTTAARYLSLLPLAAASPSTSYKLCQTTLLNCT